MLTAHFLKRHQSQVRGTRIALSVALALGVLAVFYGTGTSAFAQDADLTPLIDRMERLERDIKTLNVKLARSPETSATAQGGAPAPTAATSEAELNAPEKPGSLAHLHVRITRLENELRQSTGVTESLSHKIDQLTVRLDKLVSDIDYRLSSLEQGGVASSGTTPRVGTAPATLPVQKAPTSMGGQSGTLGGVTREQLAAVAPDAETQDGEAEQAQTTPAENLTSITPAQPGAQVDTSVLPEGSAEDRYKHAFGLLRKARYDEAEKAFLAFLQLHGDDTLASNARYWLGETHYVRKAYLKAAEIFLDAYQKSPRGEKAPDSLLKLGMSLAGLDKKDEACATFDKLQAEYTDMNDRLQKNVERERNRNGCS